MKFSDDLSVFSELEEKEAQSASGGFFIYKETYQCPVIILPPPPPKCICCGEISLNIR